MIWFRWIRLLRSPHADRHLTSARFAVEPRLFWFSAFTKREKTIRTRTNRSSTVSRGCISIRKPENSIAESLHRADDFQEGKRTFDWLEKSGLVELLPWTGVIHGNGLPSLCLRSRFHFIVRFDVVSQPASFVAVFQRGKDRRVEFLDISPGTKFVLRKILQRRSPPSYSIPPFFCSFLLDFSRFFT